MRKVPPMTAGTTGFPRWRRAEAPELRGCWKSWPMQIKPEGKTLDPAERMCCSRKLDTDVAKVT